MYYDAATGTWRPRPGTSAAPGYGWNGGVPGVLMSMTLVVMMANLGGLLFRFTHLVSAAMAGACSRRRCCLPRPPPTSPPHSRSHMHALRRHRRPGITGRSGRCAAWSSSSSKTAASCGSLAATAALGRRRRPGSAAAASLAPTRSASSEWPG